MIRASAPPDARKGKALIPLFETFLDHFGEFIPSDDLKRAINYQTDLALYQAIHKLRIVLVGRFIIFSNFRRAYCMIGAKK